MSANDDTNVINFPRLGFSLTPPNAPAPPPPATPPATTATLTDTGRRSPLDIVAALPDPALLQPPITPPTVAPGSVPATFRAEPAPDMTGPRIGALSLAACLAVAVAALRGTHTVLSSWWEQRQARQAETAPLRQARLKHQLAMQQIADKGAQQQAKTHRKVPSSSEFGRKSLSGRSSGGSGRSGGGKGSAGGHRSAGTGLGGGGSKKSRGLAKTGGSSTGSGTGGRSLFGNSKGRKNTADAKKNRPHTPPTKTPKPGKGSAGPSGGSKDRHSGGSAGGKNLRKKTRHTDQGGRSSLTSATGKALKKAAGRRLKKRRTNPDTPALWAANTKTGKGGAKTPKKTKRDDPKKTANTPKSPKTSSTPKAGKGGQGAGKAARLHAALRNAAKKATTTTPKTGKHHGPKQATKRARHTARTTLAAALRHAAHKAANRRLKHRRTSPDTPPIWTTPHTRQNTSSSGTDTPTNPAGQNTSGSTWKGFTRRNTPFQNAAQATTDTTITVEPENPRHQPRQPMALPAAASSTKEPHTMPPLPARPDPRITKARHQAARTATVTTLAAGRQMDAQHETEITLDDALDAYGEFKDDGFKTHDQCLKLAGRARALRDTLADFAEDLAVNHNLIGALFSGAMARLSESMDLVARMADEMQTSSLEAAEMSEAADNDLNDAYRPYSTATADAGLSTPSAPIHNQT